MSSRPSQATGHHQKGSRSWVPSPEDRVDLQQLDVLTQQLRDSLPHAPYVLSVPSLDPYRHHSRQDARGWMLGRLFDGDEEHLQYRTFIYREPYQDCFVLQNGEDGIAEAKASTEPKSSRPTDTASSQPKKKISLSDYKAKQANGVITPGSARSKVAPPKSTPGNNINGNHTRSATATKPVVVPAELDEDGDSVSDGSQVRNRTRTDSFDPKNIADADERKHLERLIAMFPDKRPDELRSAYHKRRGNLAATIAQLGPPLGKGERESLTQPSRREPQQLSSVASAPLDGTPHDLPPLLSPTRPSVSHPYDLVEALSPTMPKNVRLALDSSIIKEDMTVSPPEVAPQNHKPQKTNVASPAATSRGQSAVRSTQAHPEAQAMNGSGGEGMIVRLKFGKKGARALEQLLKLPQSRKPSTPADRADRQEPGNERVSKSKPKMAEKRTRPEGPEEDIPSSKRLKVPQDRPHTPVGSTSGSVQGSAQKSRAALSTPQNKSIGMARTASADGDIAKLALSGVPTPASAEKSMGKKVPDSQTWTQMSQKLNGLGRSLKYESQSILQSGREPAKEDVTRALVMCLESVLAYMAAFYTQDRSRQAYGRLPEVDRTWLTLVPFVKSHARGTKDDKHLEGLRLYLTMVIASHICQIVAQRALRQERPQSRESASQEQIRGGTPDNQILSEHFHELHKCAVAARALLPTEEIRKAFPRTWERAEKGHEPPAGPEAHFRGLGGPYFIPIGVDTTPIQAVRFGLACLEEYCQRRGVKYTLRVDLEFSN